MLIDTRTYRTELMDAAVLRFADLAGHRYQWGLCVDSHLVAGTTEPMTAELAQDWARRVLGEGVTFERGHDSGGYWVANPDTRRCIGRPSAAARRFA